MGVLAIIDPPRVVEKILQHPNLWCRRATFAPAPPPPSQIRPTGNDGSDLESPPDRLDPKEQESCLQGAEIMPNYENFITD